MIEKVNPSHPDKIADRIAGALVDLAYTKETDPRIAVEVLIGHGCCHIITVTSVNFTDKEVAAIVHRIAGDVAVEYHEERQDVLLSANQYQKMRCGDNGIFKGVPLTQEEQTLSMIARDIYRRCPTDGKYILAGNKLIICQSNRGNEEFDYGYDTIVNPIGEWTGGTDVDTGATNRKLGSDLAQSVTGGGLHGKDLSKADVSVNIYAFCMAQATGQTVELHCAIGDETVGGVPFETMVNVARRYIRNAGGFEKFAEWGLY